MTKFAGTELIEGGDDTQEDAGKFLIHGPQGAGKSTLASTIANVGPTLFIDLLGERGTRSFKGSSYSGNIDVMRPKSVTAFDDIYWALAKGDHKYKAVVIDSLTSLQKMALRFLMGYSETAVTEIRKGTAPADQRTWGESLNIMTDTATFWYSLADGDRPNPMHVIMTAQTKVTENELSGTISRGPDVQKGAMQLTLAAPDYVMYADLEEDMEAASEDGAVFRHIARFGPNPDYRTKARIPTHLRGKLPSVLGRKSAPDLSKLVKVLGLGGAQPPAVRKAKPKAETASVLPTTTTPTEAEAPAEAPAITTK